MHARRGTADRSVAPVTPTLQSRLRRSAKILDDNAGDPHVQVFRECDAMFKKYQNDVLEQMSVVNTAMQCAEQEVSKIVTQSSTYISGMDDPLRSATLYFGPQLSGADKDSRAKECTDLLTRGVPALSEDAKYIAHLSIFAHPTETVEAICGTTVRLVSDLYSNVVDLCDGVSADRAKGLVLQAESVRKLLSTMLVFVNTTHDQCTSVRGELESLQSLLEATTAVKNAACRAGKELQRENENLRSQLFQTAVFSDDKIGRVFEGDVDKADSMRAIFMLQVENTNTMRLSKPRLISESLLLLQRFVESVAADNHGKRVNYNAALEGKEIFHRVRSPMFPPESYVFDFPDVGSAVVFADRLQVGLMDQVRWPEQLLAINEFAEITDPDNSALSLWKGLRVRCALHHGTPTVSHPLAAATIEESARDPTPYYAGQALDKLSGLLVLARGGEVLVSGKATEAFQALRFANTNLAQGVTLVEKTFHGVHPAIGRNEKVTCVVSPRLRNRQRTEAKCACHPHYQTIFPSATFWRHFESTDDVRLDVFDEDSFQGATKRYSPHEYEQMLAKLREEKEQLEQRFLRLTESNNNLVSERDRSSQKIMELESLRDTLTARVHKLELRHHSARCILAAAETDAMSQQDGQTRLVSAYHVAKTNLAGLMEEVERQKAEKAKKQYESVDVQTDDGTMLEDTVTSLSLTQKVETPQEVVCQLCPEYLRMLDTLHNIQRQVSKWVQSTLNGNVSDEELRTNFTELAAKCLSSNEYSFQDLLSRANESPLTNEEVLSFLGHTAKIVQNVMRFGLLRNVAAKRGGSSGGFGDELEYLVGTNEKLEAKLKDIQAAKKKEAEQHRKDMLQLMEETDQRVKMFEEKKEEIEVRNRTLVLKLQEVSQRAQQFFQQTCVLVGQLQTLKAEDMENQRIKKEFEALSYKLDLSDEVEQTNKLLQEQNRLLKRAAEDLQKRVADKEKEMQLRETMLVKKHELEVHEKQQEEESVVEKLKQEKESAVAEALQRQADKYAEEKREMKRREESRDAQKKMISDQREDLRKRDEELRKQEEEQKISAKVQQKLEEAMRDLLLVDENNIMMDANEIREVVIRSRRPRRQTAAQTDEPAEPETSINNDSIALQPTQVGPLSQLAEQQKEARTVGAAVTSLGSRRQLTSGLPGDAPTQETDAIDIVAVQRCDAATSVSPISVSEETLQTSRKDSVANFRCPNCRKIFAGSSEHVVRDVAEAEALERSVESAMLALSQNAVTPKPSPSTTPRLSGAGQQVPSRDAVAGRKLSSGNAPSRNPKKHHAVAIVREDDNENAEVVFEVREQADGSTIPIASRPTQTTLVQYADACVYANQDIPAAQRPPVHTRGAEELRRSRTALSNDHDAGVESEESRLRRGRALPGGVRTAIHHERQPLYVTPTAAGENRPQTSGSSRRGYLRLIRKEPLLQRPSTAGGEKEVESMASALVCSAARESDGPLSDDSDAVGGNSTSPTHRNMKVLDYEGRDVRLTHGRSTAMRVMSESPIEVNFDEMDFDAVHLSRVTGAHNKSVPPSAKYITVKRQNAKIGVRSTSPPKDGSLLQEDDASPTVANTCTSDKR